MDKNTVIAIALSIIVIIVSLTIQTRFFNSNAENFEEQPIVNSIPTVGEINENNDFIQSDYINTPKTANSETPISERTDIIRTDLAEITFTNRGGDIVSFKLS